MRIAVLGSSPIMLIAARVLAGAGHCVTLLEEKPVVGGAWTAPGLCGLKHRHANLIVTYNEDDLATLKNWKEFLFAEMNMVFEPVPRALINMSTEYHTSFEPNFADAYLAPSVPWDRVRVERVEVEGDKVNVNGQAFDQLLMPAFCSIRTITINSASHEFPFDDTTSLHVICEDHSAFLHFVYVEGQAHVFDRYFKCMETGIFVARVEKALKTVPRDVMNAELNKHFQVRDIVEYTSHYRSPMRFEKFKALEGLSRGRIRVMDTRQFCLGLKDVTTLRELKG